MDISRRFLGWVMAVTLWMTMCSPLLFAMAEELQVSMDFLLTGRIRTLQEDETMTQMLLSSILSAEERLARRTDKPFTRQELAVLFAALLMETDEKRL